MILVGTYLKINLSEPRF